MSMPIMEFLMARIAEDEQEFTDTPGPAWRLDDFVFGGTDDYLQFTMGYGRAVAECKARRAVIELHALVSLYGVRGKEEGCPLCGNYETGYGWETAGPCDTLRAIAAVYADHPDYQKEWATR